VTDLFSSTAAALVRSGISAVAAMQFAISDTAAVAFARGFYAAIAHGRSVDEAVRSGRISILGARRSLEWVTPVLYLRGSATHLFTFTDTPASPAHLTGPQPPAAGKAPVSPAFGQEPGGARVRDTPSSLKAADDPAYVDGLSALLAGRFDEAVDHFTALQARFPGDSLVRERLQKALLRRDCAFWYHRGVTAAERGDWDQAVAAFGQVPYTEISDTDAFADTAERLSQARWQQRRSGLIDDMRRLHAARQWKATIAVGQELVKFDPATPDPDGMITQAKDALAEEALASRYVSGLQQFDSRDWPAAIDTFARIEHDRPGYRDTQTLLEQLRQRQRKQENDQLITELQHQLRASARTGDWTAVAVARDRLAELDPGAADPDGLATQARTALLTQLRDLFKAHEHQRAAGDWHAVPDVPADPAGPGPASADQDGLTPEAIQEFIQQISKEREGPLEKDALKRLWQSAKKVGWSQRPSRNDMKPVAAVLRSDERVVGVCRLPFSTFSSCVFVAADRNVYLCRGGTSEPHWTNNLEQVPALFRTNESLVTVPWEEINECIVEEQGFKLTFMNGAELKFPIIQWKSYSAIVARFIAAHA
jgi:outer membrane protein assembly factor BamD (BamD/ComL family)